MSDDAGGTVRGLWLRRGGIGVAILLVGAVVGWAASAVFTPPQDVLDSTAYTFVEVVQGEVGSSIALNTVAEWTPIPVGSNRAQGTVTTVNVEAGQEVGPGATLYTVDLRPVVVAGGTIPAFRSLAAGTTGTDVRQLQSMLTALKLYAGPIDGGFGAGTTVAVRAWQKSLGVPVDGVIQPGDIIFVPTLPTRIALDATMVTRGASLSGGEAVLTGLPPAPTFGVPVTSTQASLMPTGTRVEITGPQGESWLGFVLDQLSGADQTITMVLEGQDGATICADACGGIAVTEKSLLPSRIVTVESKSGLTVPSAALLSRADGTLSVIDEAGKEAPVTVITSARGMSLIEGVAAGTRVRVPAAVG
jgi:peptidoglycan hydrolase-like protein with peptidoglycan-binding domain